MIYVLIGLPGLVLLYFWLIAPRIFGRPDPRPFLGYYYAHRGLHDNRSSVPENSLAAFRKAMEHGYGIELDVQLTSDQVPVIFHDPTLKRACGLDIPVSSMTLEQLQELPLFHSSQTIPTLQQVLELVDGRVPVSVEMKIEGNDLSILPVAAQVLGGYQGPYCIISFHPLAVRWVKRHMPHIMRGQLSSNFRKDGKRNYPAFALFIFSHLILNFVSRPDFISYRYQYPHELSCRICRRVFGVPIACWTIRTQKALDKSKKYFDLFIFEEFLPK